MERPIVAIPAGDPAGIGAEIIIKALSQKEIYDICKPLIIGDSEVFIKTAKAINRQISIHIVADPSEGYYSFGTLDMLNIKSVGDGFEFGKVQANCGKAAYEFIKKSAELAMAKKVNVVATTPINKEAIKAANVNFIGHTEMYAELSGTRNPLTMFQVKNLRVFFLSRHVSLSKACSLITKDRVADFIIETNNAMKMLGFESSRLAVAGLNPHCGEHGLFGCEEVNEIEPAVQYCKTLNIDVTGPIAADSVFYMSLIGKYDAVLSLYHDQGHIAAKTLDFERTISLTLGMPFLRTSVDHGTAYDVAGKGTASSISMQEAIRLAAEYACFYNINV